MGIFMVLKGKLFKIDYYELTQSQTHSSLCFLFRIIYKFFKFQL